MFDGAGTHDCLSLYGFLLAFMAVEGGTELLDEHQT